ncbi:hypothetical protein BU24DRAFT_481466 [Aaosphaeria arxii CBS 175.79]|uniref:Uncharacterized protein n=1 Tax=Aaosphaeria arxii CBS 175.79 TaxID=1450172 RepID=A0A6A5XMM7_9PLEO|nr:uncharacterized protein BU24DRAFT_481466 [Aaosphaeria arxii CBS 175.79]KAF2014097.1 hypothetical protein BU24DRAFT_481466 [Aaosphaeria arxii CBS 175.79]
MSFTSQSIITPVDLVPPAQITDPITVITSSFVDTVNDDEEEEFEEAFLPSNFGVTGHEPNTNPSNWPAEHHRMPPHRPPVLHPQWVAVGGPLPMRMFLWIMFCGCQLLQYGYSIARATGLHDRGYGMYQIGNEW